MQAVIDTSYFIEYFSFPFDDEYKWISDAKLIVPALFAYELHNVLLLGQKRPIKDVITVHEILEALQISYVDIATHELEIYELAQNCKLTFYDASFLWLAKNKTATIATNDNALIKSAKKVNVDVVTRCP